MERSPKRLARALLVLAVVLAAVALAALRVLPGAAAGADPGARHDPGPLSLALMRLRGAPIVGIQVGHLHAREHPDELADLRVSTGAAVADLNEVDLNLAVAEALAARLHALGVRAELLPATLPPRYRADVLLSLHADASPDPARRGFKTTHARVPRNPLEGRLAAAVQEAFAARSPLPDDRDNVSGAMLDYYAFDDGRYLHAAHRATPAVIVEMGYLTHGADRAWLAAVEGPADTLAAAVEAYLSAVGRWHRRLAP